MNGRRIGITTTVPAELIWSAGAVPVDLNNLFISSPDRAAYIRRAERDGYPRNVCGWIKGIYGALMENRDIETVVAVTQGDCSNTHALMETLRLADITTIPFAYPYEHEPSSLRREIESLAARLNTTVDAGERWLGRLDPLRTKLDELDRLTWRENLVTGTENHQWLVSSSDFEGNPDSFGVRLDSFLADARSRNPIDTPVRLACIGVPPIYDDIHEVIERHGGQVVFNEVPRQFAQPDRRGGLTERYLAYTYPYDVFGRIADIAVECRQRSVQGIIHYVQSFCHRHIEDLVFRKKLDLPMLTIEGETPGPVDERTVIRIEAFIEMLAAGWRTMRTGAAI